MFKVLRNAFIILLLATTISCTCGQAKVVAEEGGESEQLKQSDDVAFVFFGDFGTGTPDQFHVAQVMANFCASHRCDFLLTLGDNIYDSGVMSVDDPVLVERIEVPYGPMGLKMYAVLGNHDYKGSPQAQIDYTARSQIWQLPSRYYSFEAGPARFIGIDTNGLNEQHQEWLKGELAAAGDWKIVFGHHPVASYGHHGPKEEVAPLLEPILKQGADFYVAGHDHDKQVIQKGTGKPLYVISGAAAKTRPTQSGEGTLFAASTLGFGYMVIHKESAELSFIDDKGAVEYTTVVAK